MRPTNFKVLPSQILLVSICGAQVEVTCTISSFSVRMRWSIIQGMWRRTPRAFVDRCQSSSITAEMVLLMFVFMINVCSWPPFYSHSDASVRFFENVECRLCIVDTAIHWNLYASLNNLIISIASLQRQMQNLMLTHLSWEFMIRTKIWN